MNEPKKPNLIRKVNKITMNMFAVEKCKLKWALKIVDFLGISIKNWHFLGQLTITYLGVVLFAIVLPENSTATWESVCVCVSFSCAQYILLCAVHLNFDK